MFEVGVGELDVGVECWRSEKRVLGWSSVLEVGV